MRITKHIRDQAWLICAIAASEPRVGGLGTSDVASELRLPLAGNGLAIWNLACEARRFAEYAGVENYELSCAEAAALLAEGWTPEGWA